MAEKKIIAIIGATGAQGRVVIRYLLQPAEDGTPSPWKVRGLTRDKTHHFAQELSNQGVELVEGSVTDMDAVATLFKGANGAFVNTDTFQLGPTVELYTLFRLYEVAQAAQIKHYVFSSLPYALKLGNWNPKYMPEHLNVKGRFGDWMLKNENSSTMLGTNLQTGPYTDGLTDSRGPAVVLPDGTRVWIAPSGYGGAFPYIALEDVGWWARHIFDTPKESAGQTFALASDIVSGKDVASAFTKVTGLPAKVIQPSVEEYFDCFVDGARVPLAVAEPKGITFRDNFIAYYYFYTSGILRYDMDWIKKINPNTTSVEKWMRDNNYRGEPNSKMSLKVLSDKSGFGPIPDPAKFQALIQKYLQ